MMPTLRIDQRQIALDPEGYLTRLDDWSAATAEALAATEGLTLTPAHWEVIGVLRAFYQQYQISPAMRILVKQLKLELGAEKGSSIYLMQLFPGSPAKLASKIAGLPKPTNCL